MKKKSLAKRAAVCVFNETILLFMILNIFLILACKGCRVGFKPAYLVRRGIFDAFASGKEINNLIVMSSE